MASVQTVAAALQEGKRVFTLAADGGYDLVTKLEQVQGLDEKGLNAIRIEKDVESKFIVGNVAEDGTLWTLDYNGVPTTELNAGKRYFERKARAMAKKANLNAIIEVTNPLHFDEEFGEISYPVVVGEVVSL